MIHGNSTDPIFIKKIYLKVWSLRDEIETLIERRLTSLENPEDFDMEELIKEYKKDRPHAQSGLTVIEGGAGEEAEEGAEEAVEAAEEEQGEEETGEAATVIQRGSHNLPADKVFKGMCILSETFMDHMYFFCNEHYLEGQSVVIEFQVPKKFIVNADVAYCRAFNMKSRVISKDKLPFRTAVKFTYLKEGERTLLRQFISSIEPEVVEQVAAPKASSSGGGDDFDDLDDFDL